MVTSSTTLINGQVRSIIRQHLRSLEPFLGYLRETDEETADISDWLVQLSRLIHLPPVNTRLETYEEAASYLRKLNDFLRLMNQELDTTFAATPIGSIWAAAEAWCEMARRDTGPFTRNEVWDWLSPAEPDSIDDLGNNVFEAKWAAPIPEMDVEIFRRTEGVRILGEPTEPADMPDGVAFRFSIVRMLTCQAS